MWDTSPADTVSLTPGTDTVPVLNYVYFLQSTKALTASTSGWPATEHAPIGIVLCQSAASLQTQGAYKVHAWTDHVTKTNQQGHIADINFWIRQQNATWKSGVAQTYSISGASPNEVLLTTTAGVVLQLHEQDFPAFSGTPTYYVVNDSTTPYTAVTDLNALTTDSTGASLTGKYYSLVIWGCVSEDTGNCKLFVNLPSGSYNNSTSAQEDASKFTNFTIPTAFKGTGFLISRWTLRNQADTTFTSIDEVDLRGFEPSITPGGTTAVPTEFDDSAFRVFDNGNNTKKLAFECSGITTGTTRTLTVPNANGTIPISFPGDSGSATPTSAGAVTIAGGAGITTSSSGNTVTIANTNAGNGEWVYIGSATASSSTTLTFTSLLDGTFDHHVLVVRNLIFSATNTGLGFNVSTNNGSSYITSGYLSGCHHHRYTSAADTNASSTTNIRLTGNAGTTRPCSLIMHMWDLFDASSYPTFSWAGTYMTDGAERHIMEGGALYNAASTVNAFRLAISAGNMVSGEAILYGINES